MAEDVIRLRPAPPYRLDLSAGGAAGGTRLMRGGILTVALRPAGSWAIASVRQLPDGSLEAKIGGEAESAEAHDALRFALALDVDHREFLARARGDAFLGPLLTRLHGLRPMRLGSPAQALVRALCGQLVTGAESARVQRRILRACAPVRAGLALPPTGEEIAGLSAAEIRACGLAARRASALARLARSFDPGELREAPAEVAVARIARERQLGAWSAGVIMMDGLGRYEQGRVGDLGLVRLRSVQLGRPAEPEETAALLEPYGEWAGLAGAYLLRHPIAKRKGPAVASPPRRRAAGR